MTDTEHWMEVEMGKLLHKSIIFRFHTRTCTRTYIRTYIGTCIRTRIRTQLVLELEITLAQNCLKLLKIF